MDFSTFAAMGGYAFHVWTSYALGLAVYGALLAAAYIRLDRLKKLDPKK